MRRRRRSRVGLRLNRSLIVVQLIIRVLELVRVWEPLRPRVPLVGGSRVLIVPSIWGSGWAKVWILAIILCGLMEKLVDPCQVSFITNWQSGDNIIITQKIFHSMLCKKNWSNSKGMKYGS